MVYIHDHRFYDCKMLLIRYFWEPSLNSYPYFPAGLIWTLSSSLEPTTSQWCQTEKLSDIKRTKIDDLLRPEKIPTTFHEFCTFRDFTSFWMCIFFLCVILSVHILTYELSLNYDNYLIGFQILLLFLFKLASNKNHVYLSFFVTCSQQIEHKSFTIQ